jgi:hypothetical protein
MLVALDDTLPERATTLLDLAATGTLSLARSGCYRDAPDAAPRAAWWAQCGADGARYEISGAAFRTLLRLGVPVTDRPARGRQPKAKMLELQIQS